MGILFLTLEFSSTLWMTFVDLVVSVAPRDTESALSIYSCLQLAAGILLETLFSRVRHCRAQCWSQF